MIVVLVFVVVICVLVVVIDVLKGGIIVFFGVDVYVVRFDSRINVSIG